jgi:ABC-type phosphate transport system permease subunit
VGARGVKEMYISITDILAAVATLIVGVIGVFLLAIKLINWYRHKDDIRDDG